MQRQRTPTFSSVVEFVDTQEQEHEHDEDPNSDSPTACSGVRCSDGSRTNDASTTRDDEDDDGEDDHLFEQEVLNSLERMRMAVESKCVKRCVTLQTFTHIF